MREVRLGNQFKRDYKHVRAGRHGKMLDDLLLGIVDLLAADQPLSARNCDHALTGEWADFRDCHVKPDLILIYRRTGDAYLDLARLGSHSELGL